MGKYVVSVGGSVMIVYHNSLVHQLIRCWDGRQMPQEQAERTVLTVLRCALIGADRYGAVTEEMVKAVLDIIFAGNLEWAIKEGSMYGGMA